MANPQLGQAVGCTSPSGAPQAIQEPSPTGLAAPQYSQVIRLSRSDSSCEAPRIAEVRLMVCHTLSFNCMFSMSCARSSRRPSRVKGLRKAEMTVCPKLAAIPIHACSPISTITPSSTLWIEIVNPVCPPDCAPR